MTSDNNNTWTSCVAAASSPSSTTSRSSRREHNPQDNYDSALNCFTDFVGPDFDFTLGNHPASPDLLAPFTAPYHPQPQVSIPGPLLTGTFDATALDLFNLPPDLNTTNWPTVDGASTGLDGSSASSNILLDDISIPFTMPNESFLTATFNSLASGQ